MSTTPERVTEYKKYVWEFDPYPGDSTKPILIDGVEGDLPDYTRGEEITVEFLLWDSLLDRNDGSATALSGGTFGGAGGMTYGGAGGGTYGVNEAPESFTDRYKDLREYGDYAGAAAHGSSANHTPWYREQLPPGAPVDTIVVQVTPGPGIETANGFWGLILETTDNTALMENYARITFRFKMLAEASEYATHSDIENDLADTL